MPALRQVLARNPGPFTLEGTRTFVLGTRDVAIIDPGPDLPEHIEALAREVARVRSVTVVLTHGHGDHAGGVDRLLELLPPGVQVVGSGHPAARPLSHGDRVPTDAGDLLAIHTPGHARDHLAYHWPRERAVFVGDVILGVGDTVWVGEYPGCVADYLATLDRLQAMDVDVVYPTHGPPNRDLPGIWERYRVHRESRIAQVRQLMAEHAGWGEQEILSAVYGEGVPRGLARAALASLHSLVEYVKAHPHGSP